MSGPTATVVLVINRVVGRDWPKQAMLPFYCPSLSTISSTKFLTTLASARPLLCFMTYPTILLSTFLFPARNAATSLGRACIAVSQSRCNSERDEDADADCDAEAGVLESAVSCSSLASWVGVRESGFVNMYLRRNFPDVPARNFLLTRRCEGKWDMYQLRYHFELNLLIPQTDQQSGGSCQTFASQQTVDRWAHGLTLKRKS